MIHNNTYTGCPTFHDFSSTCDNLTKVDQFSIDYTMQ